MSRFLAKICAALVATFMIFGTASAAKAGDVVICNKRSETFDVASFWKTGPLSCALSARGCSIASSGWWRIGPGQCTRPTTAIYAETHLAIVTRDANNRLYPAEFPVNARVLNTPRRRGSSGLGGQVEACVKRGDFRRTISGNWGNAFNQACPADYISLPLSMLVRASGDGNEIVNIR